MQDLTRRNFVGFGMGAALAAGLSAGVAVQAEAHADEGAEGLFAMGGTTLSLDELNEKRRELVASKGDFEAPDGTVVPAVWNKLRALVDTYGFGVGSAKNGEADFSFFQMMFTEEEAQAYIEMPYGVLFTAADFAAASGRDEAACAQVCDTLANHGLLWRAVRAGVPYYHHAAMAHGMFEYNLDRYTEEGWMGKFATVFTFDETESGKNGYDAGTSFYYAIPCDKDVVADEQVLLHDDYEKIIARNPVIGVSPCQCRLAGLVGGGIEPPALFSEELVDYTMPTCGHPLETCMSFGEEAQYYIDKGIARQIDQDEARSILKRSVDAGMVLQSAYTKDTEIICSCHGDCCGILSMYVALGAEGCAEASTLPNFSHYNLLVDTEACLKCGLCASRCPMFAITQDEDGAPVVDAKCIRCGQCGLACPVGARKLAAKPADEYIELPSTLLEDYNLQAAYRFEQGLIK